MPDQVDGDLLKRFAQGDLDAFEQLFRRFEREVFTWILRIVRDPATAEDGLVEAFWRAYRGRARFDPERPFGAWMRRIATNVALDQLRANRRHDWQPSGDPPSASMVSDGLREMIQGAFGKLPPKLQVVATLALIEGQTHGEIAEALDLPIGTVKSRLSRASRALKKELTQLGVRI